MLKSHVEVSETLFNVLHKVCITFGAREKSSPDFQLTCDFYYDPLFVCAFVTHEYTNQLSISLR